MTSPSCELAVLVPVLGRPHRVEPLLRSIRETCEARVVFIAERDDTEELEALAHSDADDVLLFSGNYARKLNEAVRRTEEPLIFQAADDLLFHPGWFEAAKAKLSSRVGVVGTNDLCNRRVMRGEHSTHSLVARWYTDLGTIDEPGKLLHEGYLHEWCDDELVATAKARKAFAHAPDSVVEHLHPMAGKAPMDDLYAGMRVRIRAGRKVFYRRRRLWMSPSQ